MSETLRHVSVYFDTNGVGRLVGEPNDFASEHEAHVHIEEIEKKQTKEHKVYYRVISYVPGTKLETLLRLGVVL